MKVYINGVPKQLGADYSVREGALVFERDLRKDHISGWRWLLGAWGPTARTTRWTCATRQPTARCARPPA
jgi:hypothetical protein